MRLWLLFLVTAFVVGGVLPRGHVLRHPLVLAAASFMTGTLFLSYRLMR